MNSRGTGVRIFNNSLALVVLGVLLTGCGTVHNFVKGGGHRWYETTGMWNKRMAGDEYFLSEWVHGITTGNGIRKVHYTTPSQTDTTTEKERYLQYCESLHQSADELPPLDYSRRWYETSGMRRKRMAKEECRRLPLIRAQHAQQNTTPSQTDTTTEKERDLQYCESLHQSADELPPLDYSRRWYETSGMRRKRMAKEVCRRLPLIRAQHAQQNAESQLVEEERQKQAAVERLEAERQGRQDAEEELAEEKKRSEALKGKLVEERRKREEALYEVVKANRPKEEASPALQRRSSFTLPSQTREATKTIGQTTMTESEWERIDGYLERVAVGINMTYGEDYGQTYIAAMFVGINNGEFQSFDEVVQASREIKAVLQRKFGK